MDVEKSVHILEVLAKLAKELAHFTLPPLRIADWAIQVVGKGGTNVVKAYRMT
jgi:hypothetical protein